jgi:hypothetical protein
MYRFYDILALGAAPYVRLVGCNYEKKIRRFQEPTRFMDAGQKFEFLQRNWRIRFALPHQRAVDHAIAIEKDGPPRRTEWREGICH